MSRAFSGEMEELVLVVIGGHREVEITRIKDERVKTIIMVVEVVSESIIFAVFVF